jgi:hypothetical protein
MREWFSCLSEEHLRGLFAQFVLAAYIEPFAQFPSAISWTNATTLFKGLTPPRHQQSINATDSS